MKMKRWVVLSLFSAQLVGGLGLSYANEIDERLGKTAERINKFGWRLFEKSAEIEEIVKENRQGLLISPVSAYYAFGLLANGANGESLREIASLLKADFEGLGRVGFEEKLLHEMNLDLKTFSEYLKTTVGKSEALSMANRVWLNTVAGKVVASYKDRVEDSFAAFRGNEVVISKEFAPKPITAEINNWVKSETLEMIDEVVSEEDFSTESAFVLVNALVYQGKWPDTTGYTLLKANPEDPDKEHTFTNKDGSTSTMDVFTATAPTYAKVGKNDAVSLPLASLLTDDFEDTVVGQYTVDFIRVGEKGNKLSYQTYSNLVDEINAKAANPPEDEYVVFRLPVAKLRSNIDLKLALSEGLDIETIFDPLDADFSKMMKPHSEEDNVFVKFARQVAVIDVDQFGIKAAAATVIGGNVASGGSGREPMIFAINSPYFIAIRDTKTNAVIMLAAVDSLK